MAIGCRLVSGRLSFPRNLVGLLLASRADVSHVPGMLRTCETAAKWAASPMKLRSLPSLRACRALRALRLYGLVSPCLGASGYRLIPCGGTTRYPSTSRLPVLLERFPRYAGGRVGLFSSLTRFPSATRSTLGANPLPAIRRNY